MFHFCFVILPESKQSFIIYIEMLPLFERPNQPLLSIRIYFVYVFLWFFPLVLSKRCKQNALTAIINDDLEREEKNKTKCTLSDILPNK